MDIFELFIQFQLNLLPKDWVQELWLDDFILAETLELPREYEHHLTEIDMKDLLSCAGHLLKTWLSSSDELQSPSWEVLVNNNIAHKPLLCLLSMFITQGKANIKNEKSRQLCLKAASLYFILLAIPGSSIYQIFNPILYLQAIDSIKLSSLLIVEMDNVTATKKQGREYQNQKESDGDKCEKSGDVEDLMLDKRKTLIKTLDSILSDVIFMLERFQLKGQEESFIRTIQSLILITRIERKTISVVFNSPSNNSISYLAHKAYTALIALCSTNHGNLQEIIRLIMKELLPGLLMTEKLELQVTVKERNVIKGHSIQFIHNLLMSVKQPAHLGVRALVQHLCVRTPNEAEGRAKHIQTIIEVLGILPEQLYSETVVWFLKLCHSEQVQHRITGLSIIKSILICVNKNPSTRPSSLLRLSNSANCSDDGLNDSNYSLTEAVHFSKHKYLIAAVFSRCIDNSSIVKAKALSIMGNLILSKNSQIKQEIEGIFITPYLNDISVENSKQCEKGLFDFKDFIAKELDNNIDPLPGARAFINLLEKYVYDERVFVRKSAMQVLFNICLLNEKWMTDKLLQLMVVNCKDESLLVRKLMSKGLTDLLIEYPTNSEICHYWVQGIFPLLTDPETSSQEKVIEVIQTAMLDNIVAFNKMQTPLHSLPWKLLTEILKLNMQKLFSFVCSKWNLNNNLEQSLITTIKSHIGTENSTTAWYLLASLANFMDIEEPFFILDFFYNNVHPELKVTEFVSQLVTEALYLNWKQLTILDQVELCQKLLSSLVHFNVPLHLIAPFINMCQLITEGRAVTTEQARERVKEWAGEIIKVAEKNLACRIGPDCLVVNLDENYVSRLIFTIGDATQICPNHLQHSTILMIKNLLETPEDRYGWHSLVNSKVKSVSLVTLAKLCLQDEHTANQLVPLFAKQLRKKESHKVKITAMLALTDFCVKYTNVTENYISEMSLCLRDENNLVREKALSCLIELLQKDYLKIQSSLFFHLLILLNDNSTSIRNMLSLFIVNLMLVKHKGILVKYFVESIFYYNEYNNHPTFSKQIMTIQERQAFSLSGLEKQKERRNIYKLMLQYFSEVQKLQIMSKLCTDILSGVEEGLVNLDTKGKSLLQDALYILSSKEIRLSHLSLSNKFSENMGEVEFQEKKTCAKALISTIDKKNLIDNIVPIFIALKHKLRRMKSHLVKDLMACFRELLKDYTNEIHEILEVDKELAAEILFDLKDIEQVEEVNEIAEIPQATEEVLQTTFIEITNISRNTPVAIETSSSASVTSVGEESPAKFQNSNLRCSQSNSLSDDVSKFKSVKTMSPQPGCSFW